MRLLLALLLPAACFAQGYTPPYFADSATRLSRVRAAEATISRIYTDQAREQHVPGMVYGVMVDGQFAFTGASGVTDIDRNIPATKTSAFRIASMSKSFTTLAILQLRDAGKLALDEPAGKYIPELKGIRYLTTDATPITIRQLMTHSAGFPEDNPWGDRQLADTDKELADLVKSGLSFSNVPGVQYEYSNLAFALLGKIITVVSGRPYQQYIEQQVWKPLGMIHTYWEYTKVPAKDLAHGYRWIDNGYREEALLHDGSWGAMGGIIITLEDFEKYMALHLSAWPARNGRENPVLRRASLREMQQAWRFNNLNAQYRYPGTTPVCPLVSAYGYGLRWSSDCKNRVSVGHSGGLPGFGSNWIILPEYGIGFVCFANRTYAPTSALNMQIMDTLLAITGLQPRTIPQSTVLLQRRNELVALLPDWKGAEQTGIFAENFFADYRPADLAAEAKALFSQIGQVRKVRPMAAENQLRGACIIEGEKGNLELSFTLTPESVPKIQEYHLRRIALQ